MQGNRQWLSTHLALSALWLPDLVSWSLQLSRWHLTWRGDMGRLLLAVQPQLTVLCVQRHLLWRVNLMKLRNFPASCKNCLMNFECWSVQLRPRGYEATSFLYDYTSSILVQTRTPATPPFLWVWLTTILPTILYNRKFSPLNHFCSHLNQSPWRWRSYFAPETSYLT